MKPPKKYASAAAFRVALEDRLMKFAQSNGFDLQRVRRQAAFDRLLCRLFASPDSPWLLKGGYAMELRLKIARTTRDIDLAIKQLPRSSADWDANVPDVLELLRDAGNIDLKDHFIFVFSEAAQDLDAAPYGGARFPVDARLAGRTFAKFHLDVSAGDVLRKPYEALSGGDWLAFAGISTATFQAVSPEEQFAEKLHAYTLPRAERENSRVKDLVDLILLIERTQMDKKELPQTIRETFRRRKTHDIPAELLGPPTSWTSPFAEMSEECGLEPDIQKHFAILATYFRNLGLSTKS